MSIFDLASFDDDNDPITEFWLTSVGFQNNSLRMSKLLSPITDGQIVELSLTPDGPVPRGGGLPAGSVWVVSLTQGETGGSPLDDDHVVLTSLLMVCRGQLRLLFAGLGLVLDWKPL